MSFSTLQSRSPPVQRRETKFTAVSIYLHEKTTHPTKGCPKRYDYVNPQRPTTFCSLNRITITHSEILLQAGGPHTVLGSAFTLYEQYEALGRAYAMLRGAQSDHPISFPLFPCSCLQTGRWVVVTASPSQEIPHTTLEFPTP